MSRNVVLVMVLFLAGLAGSARPSYGQVGGVPGPFGTPVSPWMNLYQRHGGPLDNYHMFVQPAEQQQNAFQNLQYGVQHNANSLNSVADQFTSQSQAYFATGSPTGVSAGFMNHGRYFFTNAGMGSGGGAFGAPGTGGLGRPGGVSQFGTPGLGGFNAGAGVTNPAASGFGGAMPGR
jgi:hypothetical protein